MSKKREDCEWAGEVTDDSMKQLFMAQQAYCDGKDTTAMALLASQINDRIPIIVNKAQNEGAKVDTSKVKMMQHDLADIIMEMQDKPSCNRLKERIIKIDGKYALPAYYAFASCTSKRRK